MKMSIENKPEAVISLTVGPGLKKKLDEGRYILLLINTFWGKIKVEREVEIPQLGDGRWVGLSLGRNVGKGSRGGGRGLRTVPDQTLPDQ